MVLCCLHSNIIHSNSLICTFIFHCWVWNNKKKKTINLILQTGIKPKELVFATSASLVVARHIHWKSVKWKKQPKSHRLKIYEKSWIARLVSIDFFHGLRKLNFSKFLLLRRFSFMNYYSFFNYEPIFPFHLRIAFQNHSRFNGCGKIQRDDGSEEFERRKKKLKKSEKVSETKYDVMGIHRFLLMFFIP